MPLQQTSGNVTSDAYGGGTAVTPVYIEEIFSTFLYTGNGSTQTITNGIDLSTKGGLVWTKKRDSSTTSDHFLMDTARGTRYALYSNSTTAQLDFNGIGVTAYNTNGYDLGGNTRVNGSGLNYVGWTFRKQPKFFDVVTYTGDGQNDRQVPHSLGSTPGCIIVKCLNFTGGGGPQNWAVYHRSVSPAQSLILNSTAAAAAGDGLFGTATSTYFVVNQPGGGNTLNANGDQYVAYVFAHNAGGFGLTGTDNVISCGSFTGNTTVNLGYEPQWIMIKKTNAAGSWTMWDTMRGWSQTQQVYLYADLSNAESSSSDGRVPNATGFTTAGYSAGDSFIYIAIRRGPMKVPTDGTSVFTPVARTGTGSATTLTSAGFPPDLYISQERTLSSYFAANWFDRLRGSTKDIWSAYTDAEYTAANTVTGFDAMQGVILGTDGANFGVNASGVTYANWNFRRAPSFFDEVCYTGTGTYGAINHNLGVTPELVIYKSRSNSVNWGVIKPVSSIAYYDGILNSTSAFTYYSNDPSVAGLYTSTQFAKYQDTSGYTYVAYLFATCAGVSKVGTYTGNGTTQTINCGFTGGARFVLIKRTDSTGDWYVYDTARGMTVLTDPYLLLNSTAAESATLGSVTTVSTGFAVNASILAAINTNAASYIFLAIA